VAVNFFLDAPKPKEPGADPFKEFIDIKHEKWKVGGFEYGLGELSYAKLDALLSGVHHHRAQLPQMAGVGENSRQVS
jgi:hypothetical protein